MASPLNASRISDPTPRKIPPAKQATATRTLLVMIPDAMSGRSSAAMSTYPRPAAFRAAPASARRSITSGRSSPANAGRSCRAMNPAAAGTMNVRNATSTYRRASTTAAGHSRASTSQSRRQVLRSSR